MKTKEPAAWVADEDIWDKAKKAARKADPEDKWALTTYLYKRMGGEVKPKKEADKTGVKTTHWFWGVEAFAKTSVKKPMATTSEPISPGVKSADEQARDLLLKNPDITGATLLNAMKAEGIELVDKKAQVQADSVTTQPAVLRQKESCQMQFGIQFLEAGTNHVAGVGPTRFKVALIQEGLGNLRDAFYYTREALETGVVEFEGKKCYADHPSRSEEQDRPERSVRDIIGYFEKCHIEENDDGSARLCAELVMPLDPPFEWARSLVRNAISYNKQYPEQNLVGLSINASGDARVMPIEEFLKESLPQSVIPKVLKARDEAGVTQVRVVSAITDAISCDLVTEPGAKGKVIELVEANKGETMKQAKKDPAQLKADEGKKMMMMAEESEDEAKKMQAEEGAEEQAEPQDHEDIEKDKELILDMIKKHMGDEEIEEEAKAPALEAYEAYKAMGESEEEAMKCAGKAMKLAKHMAAKKQAEAEAVQAEESEESEEAKHSESNVVKLTARIALLERELKKRELAEALDSKLKESGLGRAETDKLRKLIGTPKSVSDIEKTIKIFKEAFDSRGESVKKSIFVMGAEKETARPQAKAKVSFGSCLEE